MSRTSFASSLSFSMQIMEEIGKPKTLQQASCMGCEIITFVTHPFGTCSFITSVGSNPMFKDIGYRVPYPEFEFLDSGWLWCNSHLNSARTSICNSTSALYLWHIHSTSPVLFNIGSIQWQLYHPCCLVLSGLMVSSW